MTRPRGDAGTIAPLVPVFGFILLLLGGLVIDASRLLTVRGRAVAYAEEAARAGASAIRPGQSELQLEEAVVQARVAGYCTAIRNDPTQQGGVTACEFRPPLQAVSARDGRRLVVRVFVRLEIPASLLGIVGVQTLTASGVGEARPFEGIDPDDVDSSPPPLDVDVPVDPPPPPPPGATVSLPPELPVPTPSTPPLPPVSPPPGTSPPPAASPPAGPAPEPSLSPA